MARKQWSISAGVAVTFKVAPLRTQCRLPAPLRELLVELDLAVLGHWLFVTTPQGVFAFVEDLSVWAWIEQPVTRQLLWSVEHPSTGIEPQPICEVLDAAPVMRYVHSLGSISQWIRSDSSGLVHPSYGTVPFVDDRRGFALPFRLEGSAAVQRLDHLLSQSVYTGTRWETAFTDNGCYQRFRAHGITVTLHLPQLRRCSSTYPRSVSWLGGEHYKDIRALIDSEGDGLLGPVRLSINSRTKELIYSPYTPDDWLSEQRWLVRYQALDDRVADGEYTDRRDRFNLPHGSKLLQWLVVWSSGSRDMLYRFMRHPRWHVVYLMPANIMSSYRYEANGYRPPELVCYPFGIHVDGMDICYLDCPNGYISLTYAHGKSDKSINDEPYEADDQRLRASVRAAQVDA